MQLSDTEFVAFDTETTGIFAGADAIVEIAAIRFKLKEGVIESFQTLVNPERKIPPGAMRVHGITDAMVKDAPTVDRVIPQFLDFSAGAHLVAHNAPFDIGFVGMHLLRNNLTMPDNAVFDTCSFSRKIMPSLPTHKLEALVSEFNIKQSGFHRALEDTRYCAEVFRKQTELSCGHDAHYDDLVKHHGEPLFFHENIRRLYKLPQKLSPLMQALNDRQPVWIDYQGGYGPRAITPLVIYAKGKSEYVDAICGLDDSRKSFRLDRIKRVYEGNNSIHQ